MRVPLVITLRAFRVEAGHFRCLLDSILCSHQTVSNMGKLNIAHHKSYHPYRRDNIERVRRDEEAERLKEEQEEGRIRLAVSQSESLSRSFILTINRLYRIVRHVSRSCVNERDLRAPLRNRGRSSTTRRNALFLSRPCRTLRRL